MKRVLVLGAGGFIGHHLVSRLKKEGTWVRGVDLRPPTYERSVADEFLRVDLRDQKISKEVIDLPFDELYQLAADMGGAEYIYSGQFDAEILYSNTLINLNVLEASRKAGVKRIFFASSACVYPKGNQKDPNRPVTAESSVYPADPDSDYGVEKLYAERLYCAFARASALEVRIARFHNVFGEQGPWKGGREKAPAAICRKIIEAKDGGDD